MVQCFGRCPLANRAGMIAKDTGPMATASSMPSAPAFAVLALCASGCAGRSTGMISLADGVAPFRDRFNAATERARFVAILSPTCGPCVAGAVAVNETIVKGFSATDVDVSVVWIDVLPTDDAAAARRSASVFEGTLVAQYHDPNQLLGNAIAEGLIARPPAWDVYLFYPPGARWEEAPPKPVDWRHQLSGETAQASRFKTGDALAADLHVALERLGGAAKRPAPDKDRLARANAEATMRIGQADRENARDRDQCARCRSSGMIGQCSISGWRSVIARRIPDQDGTLTNRFEMSGGAGHPPASDVNGGDARRVFAVEGMACSNCMTRVAGHALSQAGVARVEVDFDARRLIVYTSQESGSALETLPIHLEAGGFHVTPLVLESHPDLH